MSRFSLRSETAGIELLGRATPPDWDEVFGFQGPLELEIGCGAGGFALDYCQKYPHVRFVAFEWRKKFAREVWHRAQKRGISNLRILEGDAKFEVPRLFAPNSLSVIHVQFPDPWWKRSHQKRAVITHDFALVMFSLLVPDGLFDMRTDVEDRAHHMLDILESAGFHNPLGTGQFHPYDENEVPSTREKRYLLSGQPVFRARLKKPLRSSHVS